MDRPKQFTIIPRDLRTPPEEFASALRRAMELVPGLVVDKEDYRGGIVTVSLPEQYMQEAVRVLGAEFVLSPNSKLNLIR